MSEIEKYSGDPTTCVIRINSEDTKNGWVMLNKPVTTGSVAYYILNWTQSNYNITTPAAFYVNNVAMYLPAGYYNQASACTYLQALLTATIPGTWSVSPATDTTNLVTISNSVAFTINAALCSPILIDLLGFSTTGTYTGLVSYTGSSSGPGGYKGCGMSMVISGIKFIDNGDISTRNGGTSMFIPYSKYGVTSQYADYAPVFWRFQDSRNIQALKVDFLDFYGNSINFNGGSWVLQIFISGKLRNHY